MKKKILIFIFLVITVGGIIFTAFTAYRFSTITDLAIKHSAETVRDIYLYSENKDEALQLIKNMPNIESVDIVDKSTYKKIDKNCICIPLNTEKDVKLHFKSLAEFENEKYNVILETIIINVIFIAISNLLLNWLLNPYLNIFEGFKDSIEKAKHGDFSGKLHTKLKNDLQKIVITACGTSWHSGLIAKYLIESLAQISVEVDYASEYRYRNPILNKNTLLIPISQSGETADTLAAVKMAKTKGCKILSVCNVFNSSIPRESDGVIYTYAGPEIGVASTKAFTTQISVLLLFAVYLKKIREGYLDKKILKEALILPENINESLSDADKIYKLAGKYHIYKDFLYLGRGINFPIALEGALKLKEISYIHAEGYPSGEMKHGPIALIDEKMPTFIIATNGNHYDKVLSNLQEIKARKGKVIAIATRGNTEIEEFCDDVIYIPETIAQLEPFLSVIPMQLFAYYVADIKGTDVDQPRNLAKSVTVE